jgi:uncharacterized protein
MRRVQSLNRDRVGLGWRSDLSASIFSRLDAIDVVEVIAEDYFDASARALRSLRTLGSHVPVVLHGVSLGLASTVPVALERVDRLARVINAVEPETWSEHLAFVRGAHYEIGHLAAPPRNSRTIEGAVRNIEQIRKVVGQPFAVENIATLIDPPDSSLSEAHWVTGIATNSDSTLLLDLHNLYANAVNFGPEDPVACLRSFPLERVRLVHISGGRWMHLESTDPGVSAASRLLDDHLHDVPKVVFSMLQTLAECCPQPLTVILERDGNYPDFPLLLAQLSQARAALAAGRQKAYARGSHEFSAV